MAAVDEGMQGQNGLHLGTIVLRELPLVTRVPVNARIDGSGLRILPESAQAVREIILWQVTMVENPSQAGFAICRQLLVRHWQQRRRV